MNAEQAKLLAHRLIDTWPGYVVKAQIWCDAIADLDYEGALGVYEFLRDNDEKPPTISRFLAVYRSIRPGADLPMLSDTGPIVPKRIGVQMAYQAYVDECWLRNRTPKPQNQFAKELAATMEVS